MFRQQIAKILFWRSKAFHSLGQSSFALSDIREASELQPTDQVCVPSPCSLTSVTENLLILACLGRNDLDQDQRSESRAEGSQKNSRVREALSPSNPRPYLIQSDH
jgi:hypothetical protein